MFNANTAKVLKEMSQEISDLNRYLNDTERQVKEQLNLSHDYLTKLHSLLDDLASKLSDFLVERKSELPKEVFDLLYEFPTEVFDLLDTSLSSISDEIKRIDKVNQELKY